MRSFHLFIFSLLSHLTLQAQSDTLYVNDTHTLALVFPNPIVRAVTGHPDYTFGYDTDSPGRLGLLQGHPGTDSNLLVLTDDGLAYSFYLVYRKRLQEGHWFVKVDKSIGNVQPEKWLDTLGQGMNRSIKPSLQSDSIQYRKGSTYFMEKNQTVLKSKRRDGIVLRLRDVAYYGTDTYLVMEMENRSDIDFEVDFVQVFKAHGNPRKKSSYQKLRMEPVYRHRMPSMVKVGQKQCFVYVVPKFTLGDWEKLMVELREKRGSRRVVLQWD
ncbi:MAG: conjugative transposon protein TraN [Flavobacteriaceae bacterium]|nr:conjugative transposon protein TraN [Flavobacteriaceae bacterium]